MCTLNELKTGQKGIVYSLNGGEQFVSRITAMGFTPQTPLVIVSGRNRGPLIVYLRDTAVALGRGEAAKITVLVTEGAI